MYIKCITARSWPTRWRCATGITWWLWHLQISRTSVGSVYHRLLGITRSLRIAMGVYCWCRTALSACVAPCGTSVTICHTGATCSLFLFHVTMRGHCHASAACSYKRLLGTNSFTPHGYVAYCWYLTALSATSLSGCVMRHTSGACFYWLLGISLAHYALL